MDTENIELQRLLEKYLDNTISSTELKQFWEQALTAPETNSLHDNYEKIWKEGNDRDSQIMMYDYAAAFQLIKERLELNESRQAIFIRKRRNWMVAAAVIVLVSVGLFLQTGDKSVDKQTLTKVEPGKQIRNCNNCATLTLGDGSVIELDTAASGKLASQGNTQIVKLEGGQLAYEGGNEFNAAVPYNTVSTPRGSTHQIVLVDGTKVWLNAASSIRFPAAFVGAERKVEITGEVYFEVARNSELPFKVAIRDCEIKVLGTAFNINGYREENAIKTTLLEGSISLKVNDNTQLLKPGQQLSYTEATKKIKVGMANIDDVLAWKEGFFYFDNDNIQTLLREIGRWYDVEIVYEGALPERGFKGEIGRDLSLQDVVVFLKKLKINAELQGNILKISP